MRSRVFPVRLSHLLRLGFAHYTDLWCLPGTKPKDIETAEEEFEEKARASTVENTTQPETADRKV